MPPLVSQRQSTSAPGVFGGFESAQREVAVVDVAVEEVFGVVDHFFAVVLQIADGFGDDGEVFVFGDAESAGDMEVPALAEDGDDGGSGIDQLTDVAVFLNGILREARGSEGCELCMLQLQTARLLEEFFVFGIGTRPSAFNVVNTELIEFPGNEDFVIDRERDGFALRAVPKSGIESLNAHGD